MSKMHYEVALLCLFILISGCSNSRQLFEAPRSREDVNLALHRYMATIILKDGQVIERIANAHLGTEELEYTKGKQRNLPLSEVARIDVEVDRGRGIGALIGVAPGITLIGIGAVTYVTAPEDSWGKLGAVYIGAAGFVGTLVGGLLGSMIGGAVRPNTTYTIYEAPPEFEDGGSDDKHDR